MTLFSVRLTEKRFALDKNKGSTEYLKLFDKEVVRKIFASKEDKAGEEWR
jgi:hypothetical protein